MPNFVDNDDTKAQRAARGRGISVTAVFDAKKNAENRNAERMWKRANIIVSVIEH